MTWYVGMSKLVSQVSRSGNLRIVDVCCLPTSLWRDVINNNTSSIALDKCLFQFFVNFYFKGYVLVKIFWGQLKHVDGLVYKTRHLYLLHKFQQNISFKEI